MRYRLLVVGMFIAIIIMIAVAGCGTVPLSMVKLNQSAQKELAVVEQDLANANTAIGELYLDFKRHEAQDALEQVIDNNVYPTLQAGGFDQVEFKNEVVELYNDMKDHETMILLDTMAKTQNRTYPAMERLKWALSLQGSASSRLNKVDYDAAFTSIENSMPGVESLIADYRTSKEASETAKRTRREKVWAENDRLRKEANGNQVEE